MPKDDDRFIPSAEDPETGRLIGTAASKNRIIPSVEEIPQTGRSKNRIIPSAEDIPQADRSGNRIIPSVEEVPKDDGIISKVVQKLKEASLNAFPSKQTPVPVLQDPFKALGVGRTEDVAEAATAKIPIAQRINTAIESKVSKAQGLVSKASSAIGTPLSVEELGGKALLGAANIGLELIKRPIPETPLEIIALMSLPEVTGKFSKMSALEKSTIEKSAQANAEISSKILSEDVPPIEEVLSGKTVESKSLGNIISKASTPPPADQIPLSRAHAESLEFERRRAEVMRSLSSDLIEKIRKGESPSPEFGQRVFQLLAQEVELGRVDSAAAMSHVGIQDTGDRALNAKLIREFASSSGRVLKSLSEVSKQITTIMAEQVEKNKDPSLAGRFKDFMAGLDSKYTATPHSRLGELFRRVEYLRRAELISNMSTFTKIALSQGLRYSMGIVSDASAGVLGAVTGKIPMKEAFDMATADVFGIFNSLDSRARDSLVKELSSRLPSETNQIMWGNVGEITMDKKVSRFLTTLHRFSNQFFSLSKIDARIRSGMAQRGLPYWKISQVPDDLLNSAMREGMEVVLQAPIEKKTWIGQAANMILDAYKRFPVLGAFSDPFIRFFMNLTRTHYEFSPIPLLSPRTYARMANPDPKIAFDAIGKAFTGSLLVGAGMMIEGSGNTGSRWYKIKVPGLGMIDARSFSIALPQVFSGIMLMRALTLAQKGLPWSGALMDVSNEDWTQIFLSHRRGDLLGFPIVDAVQSPTLHGFKNKMTSLFSNYISGFSASLRQFKSFSSPFRPGEAVLRETDRPSGEILSETSLKQSQRDKSSRAYVLQFRDPLVRKLFRNSIPVLGRFMNNIPYLSEYLPTRNIPVKSTPEVIPNPIMFELGGVLKVVDSPAQRELERLGLFPGKNLYPHTGSPALDYETVKNMGPLIEQFFSSQINSSFYSKLSDSGRRGFWSRVLPDIKRAATESAASKVPPEEAYKKAIEKVLNDLNFSNEVRVSRGLPKINISEEEIMKKAEKQTTETEEDQ